MIELLLVFKYIKKHIKQVTYSILCIAMFTGAILAVQLFNSSY